MIRRYGGPLVAVVISIFLLATVLFTRNAEAPATPTATPATEVSALPTAAPTAAPRPTLTPVPPGAPTPTPRPLDRSTLNEALVGAECITKLNPLLAGYNHADRDVTSLIFEGLMATDQRGALVPALAAAQPTVSEDGVVYVMKLRTDVKWQDGTPFTSADVVFTVGLMQDPAFTGPADLHRFWRTVEIDALDAQTVRFTLAQPLATFTDYLRVGIVPEHVLRGATGATLRTHPANLNPVGTGPFQIAGLIGDGSRVTGVRLRFSPTYAKRPEGQAGFTIKQIVFHCLPTVDEALAAFQRGEINTISGIAPDAVGALGTLPINPLPAYRPSLGAVIYNWRSENTVFFRDLRLRQALFASLDRAELVQSNLADRAIIADSPILPSSWAYAQGVKCPSFDLERAKRDLGLVQLIPTAPPADATPDPANAQPAITADGKLRFQVLVSDDPALAAMTESIVGAWRGLGLEVTRVVVDRTTFRERLASGNFDAALVELNLEPLADPDPYSLWRQIPAEGGLNFGGLNDRRLSEIMESARREPNGIARAALYQQFQQAFCDRAAAILLYYPAYFYGVDQRVTGVQIGFMSDPSDRFRTLPEWRVAEAQ